MIIISTVRTGNVLGFISERRVSFFLEREFRTLKTHVLEIRFPYFRHDFNLSSLMIFQFSENECHANTSNRVTNRYRRFPDTGN